MTDLADIDARTISFRVPGVPCAQPRARATTVNGHARMYEAKKSHPIHTFKASVKLAASQAYGGPMIECAVKLTVMCVFPRPGRMVWKTRQMPRAPMVTKPDTDNLIKGVCDALNGLLWRDDSQVCFALVTKEYAAGGEQAHVDVTIEIMA